MMSRSIATICCTACVLALAAFASPTHAAEGEEVAKIEKIAVDAPEPYAHVLSGHAFLPNFLLPSPFAQSTAQLAIGFAYRTFDDASLIVRNLQLGAFSPRVQGSIRLIPRLSLLLGASFNFVTGLNGRSAVQYGASAGYNLKVGGLYEFMRDEKRVLSGSIEISRPHSYTVSPLTAAGELVQNILSTGDPEVLSSSVETAWRPGVRYAQGINPTFGFSLFTGLRFYEVPEGQFSSGSRDSLTLGASADADFRPLVNFPIGVTVSFLRNQKLTSDGVNTNAVAFGLFDTWGKAFNFGGEFGFGFANSRTTTVGAIVLRANYD